MHFCLFPVSYSSVLLSAKPFAQLYSPWIAVTLGFARHHGACHLTIPMIQGAPRCISTLCGKWEVGDVTGTCRLSRSKPPFGSDQFLTRRKAMQRKLVNYDTLLKIAGAISHSRDPEEVVLMTVESMKTALDVKGCAVFLINRRTDELELAASFGLSADYIGKGPVSASRSIAHSLDEGPGRSTMFPMIRESSIPKRHRRKELLPYYLSPSWPEGNQSELYASTPPNRGSLPWMT